MTKRGYCALLFENIFKEDVINSVFGLYEEPAKTEGLLLFNSFAYDSIIAMKDLDGELVGIPAVG